MTLDQAISDYVEKHAEFAAERRDELARIIETVAKDGLPEPRDLDVACDAIEELFKV